MPAPKLKQDLMAAIRQTPQLPAVEPAAQGAGTSAGAQAASARKPARRYYALAAGILLVASGALGGTALHQYQQRELLEQQLQALAAQQSQLAGILSAPDVKTATASMGGQSSVALSYSLAEGSMAVTTWKVSSAWASLAVCRRASRMEKPARSK